MANNKKDIISQIDNKIDDILKRYPQVATDPKLRREAALDIKPYSNEAELNNNNMANIPGFNAYYNILNPRSYQQGGDVSESSPEEQLTALAEAAIIDKDENAMAQIQQIIEAAQNGDEQMQSVAQFLISKVQELQEGVAQSAKFGAKLNYIHKLRTGLNPDEDVVYQKCGGRMRRRIVKKGMMGMEMSDEMMPAIIDKLKELPDEDKMAVLNHLEEVILKKKRMVNALLANGGTVPKGARGVSMRWIDRRRKRQGNGNSSSEGSA